MSQPYFPSKSRLDALLESASAASESERGGGFYMRTILNEQVRETSQQIMEKRGDVSSYGEKLLQSYHDAPKQVAPIFRLPYSALAYILRWVFIPRPYHPVVLPREPRYGDQTYEYIKAVRRALTTCKAIYQIGRMILYKENTFTAATPSTSYDVDLTLSRMCKWQQDLITSIILKIDWADELWTKFPLIAVALQGLKKLRNLEIYFVSTTQTLDRELRPSVRANEQMHEVRRGAARSQHWHGTRAEVMLKAEKRMLADFVSSKRSLRTFKLVGFADEDFARQLELYLDIKSHGGGFCVGSDMGLD